MITEKPERPREWTIQEATTTILPPDLRIAQRHYPGEVDPSPHWVIVIEHSAYAKLARENVELLLEIRALQRNECGALEQIGELESRIKYLREQVLKLEEHIDRLEAGK